MLVDARFQLDAAVKDELRALPLPFGYDGYGEYVFYRTYSRQYVNRPGEKIPADYNGPTKQESWSDVVIRVIEGVMSIRKDWQVKHGLRWDEVEMRYYAARMARSFHALKWSPPGRGCWAMGTDYVYERGAMPLVNCAYTALHTLGFADDIYWLMDCLMNGCGVGFDPEREPLQYRIFHQELSTSYPVFIEDTREGWCESVRVLINSYMRNLPMPIFDYSRIRAAGSPIRGFGGICSGCEPLKKLHRNIHKFFCMYTDRDDYDIVMLKTDIANACGCCAVAGNVRRSAEIAVGEIGDDTFMNMKQYEQPRFAYRAEHGWMSNNSARLRTAEDFDKLGEIAQRVTIRGEPGVINLVNMQCGRIGKQDNIRYDAADGFNPCAEIPLEDKETCIVAETYPTRCEDDAEWYTASEYATFYCSTVALLPTHSQETNAVVARNRRIGVGLVDYTGWIQSRGVHKVTRYLRNGYKRVREVNRNLALSAGVPESIRVTTVKPGGTMPKLAGVTAGAGYPTFTYTLRRTREAIDSPTYKVLVAAGIPFEKDAYSDNSVVFTWPIVQGPAPPGTKVSIWQQAANLVLLQREWSDNAVSNTIYFRPKLQLVAVHENVKNSVDLQESLRTATGDGMLIVPDTYVNTKGESFSYKVSESGQLRVFRFDHNNEEDQIEAVLSSIMPLIKSCSLLPHSAKGAYAQMPEEGITHEEYEKAKAAMPRIDWTQFRGSNGEDEKYCSGPGCEVL